jgi:hypothetical protein
MLITILAVDAAWCHPRTVSRYLCRRRSSTSMGAGAETYTPGGTSAESEHHRPANQQRCRGPESAGRTPGPPDSRSAAAVTVTSQIIGAVGASPPTRARSGVSGG